MHLVFLDHPVEELVPFVPRHALLGELSQGMTGGAVEINRDPPRANGKAAVLFGLPTPRRIPLGRRHGWGEDSPTGHRGRDDRGREEQRCRPQDAYTEIRCMELFM